MQLSNTTGDMPSQDTRQRDVLYVASTGRDFRMAVIRDIAANYGVTVADILGRSHLRCYAWPRQAAMAAIRDRFPDTLHQIGRLFGRDHTTVLSGINAAKARGDRL